ncbi:hypothetical protein [Microbacterium ulmi]|uniref:Uncharacterized protein n=1 Tax=Microbacterium ulmi TaxID=179095 RepID=A0A7Y2M014_9MICO|nr:hypothetical protein [Microbacterium ulmi]NII69392.1 hypothetical protein [Microbacterium ulmi]NNH03996.1 hypothetical protein [Microbacterium ulmi]
MNSTLPTIDARISAFAAAVRAELADLPGDDVDELVDGLEADLAEQASESADFAIPDAAAYAAELRSAAGFPDRSADAAVARVPLRTRVATGLVAASGRIRSSRVGAWLLDLLVALRPVWWIARGWALFAMLSPLLGSTNRVVGFPAQNGAAWLLLLGFILLSVQWGRGRWAPVAWLRVIRIIVSIVTAIALPFLVGGAIASTRSLLDYTAIEYIDSSQPGLTIDGERVRNLFAYDSDGNPLTDVQLFDQSGRPLTTIGRSISRDSQWDEYFYGGGGPVPVPLTAPGRTPVWNVFPLREMPAFSVDPDPSSALLPDFPFPKIPAVQSSVDPSPTPSPTADGTNPTPTPTDGVLEPTPTPTEAVQP